MPQHVKLLLQRTVNFFNFGVTMEKALCLILQFTEVLSVAAAAASK